MDNSTNVAKYAVKFSHQYKDMFFITFGILMYAFGYTAFILPEHVVMGGVAGISALLFYAFKLPPGIAIWVLNLTMLVIAYRALSKQFVIRTVIGVTILSSLVGVLQPLFEQYPVITPGEDKFMHVLIGGALGGAGLGIVFSHNGSTGGTDIIALNLHKHFPFISTGTIILVSDILVLLMVFFVYHSIENVLYALLVIFISI